MKYLALYEAFAHTFKTELVALDQRRDAIQTAVIAEIERRAKILLAGLKRNIILNRQKDGEYEREEITVELYDKYDTRCVYTLTELFLDQDAVYLRGFEHESGRKYALSLFTINSSEAIQVLELLETLGEDQATWLAREEGTEMGFFNQETKA